MNKLENIYNIIRNTFRFCLYFGIIFPFFILFYVAWIGLSPINVVISIISNHNFDDFIDSIMDCYYYIPKDIFVEILEDAFG